MCCSNAWSSAGAGATSLHQTAGCMLAADIICCCLQAAGPRERPQQIMKQCSTHACPVCFAVPQWHVFVCNIFLKPVATHASPQSSWTRSTIVRHVAAPVGPTGSASGRTGPTKTLQSGTPSRQGSQATFRTKHKDGEWSACTALPGASTVSRGAFFCHNGSAGSVAWEWPPRAEDADRDQVQCLEPLRQ